MRTPPDDSDRRGRAGEASPEPSGGRAELFAAMHEVVAAIPWGHVATYGQVAELAGLPGGARIAAAALKAAPEGLPWHRVVGKRSRGMAAIRILDPVGAAIQRERLEAEGVALTDSGGIRLADYGWLPA